MTRLIKWERHVSKEGFLQEANNLNKCKRAMDGIREFIFSLSCSVFEWIRKKGDVQYYPIHGSLYISASPWRNADPVDLAGYAERTHGDVIND